MRDRLRAVFIFDTYSSGFCTIICFVEPTYISERITVNPKQCGGKPCIRGMRIRVIDVLDLLGNGLNVDDVLNEFPKLEREDVLACIKYARNQIDHVVLAA